MARKKKKQVEKEVKKQVEEVKEAVIMGDEVTVVEEIPQKENTVEYDKNIQLHGKIIKVFDINTGNYSNYTGAFINLKRGFIYYLPNPAKRSDVRLIDDLENKLEIVGIDNEIIKVTPRVSILTINDGDEILR